MEHVFLCVCRLILEEITSGVSFICFGSLTDESKVDFVYGVTS